MILSGQTIRRLCTYQGNRAEGFDKSASFQGMVAPFMERRVHESGMSYGLSIAGYDIRVDWFKVHEDTVDTVRMQNGDFVLASSVERIKMPNDVIAFVKDKSSWARKGLAVQNTVLEPGWEGFITLELSFHRPTYHVNLKRGMPIAQVIFQRLDESAEKPYTGKYQNQEAKPVEAKEERPIITSKEIIDRLDNPEVASAIQPNNRFA